MAAILSVICEMAKILSGLTVLTYWGTGLEIKHMPLGKYTLTYHGALRSMLIFVICLFMQKILDEHECLCWV